MRGTLLLALQALLIGSCDVPRGNQDAPRFESTLAAVKARGFVRCGASKDAVGFGAPDASGYWRGLDIDTCRAVAAAVLGDRERARFVPLTGQQRLLALQTGEIDVLPRTTTWTLSRDANGINFTLPTYFDRTAFMVRSDSGIRDVHGLAGATVCVQTGSMTEVTFADVSRRHGLAMDAVTFDSLQNTRQAFLSGRCDALISDASLLASARASQTRKPADYAIFPADDEVHPLTPAVRHGDDQWFDIVKFSIDAMLLAEQLGVSKANIRQMARSRDPVVRRFLGLEAGNGRTLGLDDDFAFRIVNQVGNYADVYDRNLGDGSALRIPRGLNRLQRDGGLMVPIAFF